MNERFFFDTDSDCHWYMLPEHLREQWDAMTLNDIDYDNYEAQDKFEDLFTEYRINMHPSNYSFKDPKEVKSDG